MNIGVFTFASALHNQADLNQQTQSLLQQLENRSLYEINHVGEDFTTYGQYDLNIIYIKTGGTEGDFLKWYRNTLPPGPFYLLASHTNNSLAASMEILSFLKQQQEQAEIIHGDIEWMCTRLNKLLQVEHAIHQLNGMRLGMIGKPSDWLIASQIDEPLIKHTCGISLIEIPMQSLFDEVACGSYALATPLPAYSNPDALEQALRIYGALKRIIARHHLSGITVRCFDLLKPLQNTSCLAFALLNQEGIVATCEGDLATLFTMVIAQALLGQSGFQANPAAVDVIHQEMVLAHCTLPLSMPTTYTFDTHFESGLGVAICGKLPRSAVTIFKMAGDLSRAFVAEGAIIENLASPLLCRTQVRVKLATSLDYFLNDAIGNHHVILSGNHQDILETFIKRVNGMLPKK